LNLQVYGGAFGLGFGSVRLPQPWAMSLGSGFARPVTSLAATE
jgi:hypothetical protein